MSMEIRKKSAKEKARAVEKITFCATTMKVDFRQRIKH